MPDHRLAQNVPVTLSTKGAGGVVHTGARGAVHPHTVPATCSTEVTEIDLNKAASDIIHKGGGKLLPKVV